jgi:hypothetical protein
MELDDLKGKIFVGMVEENEDPKKIGRVKVRVMNVYDEIPVEDIPWASPWKDLNGNEFNIPDVGKVVSVVFDHGDQYKPEYIFAEHYNVNLQKKLNELSGKPYTSMKALMFDHKTQIYSNDTEGLKIDYKLNNINITSDSINVNLKDNMAKLNLGTPTANQQSILGNNFLDWFDEFVDNLLGSKAGPYLGNLGSPVIANPAFIDVLLKYKALKDPKFLSHHVNVVDNEYVDKQDRIADGQLGDAWKSTVTDNTHTKREPIDYKSVKGNSTDTPAGDQSTYVDEKGNVVDPSVNLPKNQSIEPTNNPDVDKIINTMIKKGYKIFTRPYEANIVAIRRQYEGQKYSNAFKDDLYLIFKIDNTENWEIYKFKISTMPGFYQVDENGKKNKNGKFNIKQSAKMLGRGKAPNNGIGILKEAQYINLYKIDKHIGAPAMKTLGNQLFYRDNSPGDTIKYTGEGVGFAAMYIHKGYPGGSEVSNWSEGCCVFSNATQLEKFFSLCEEHKNRYGNVFSYSLMLERDL